MNWPLLANSLVLSAFTTLFAAILGFASALWLSCLGPRLRKLFMILAIIALMMPPFVAANCWLDLFGLNGVLRPWLPLNAYSLPGAVTILSLLYWPIPMFAAFSALRRIDPAQLEADPALRSGNLIRWLLWPAARSRVALGAMVTFVLAFNNFSVPSLLQVKVYPTEVWLAYNLHLDAAASLLASWPMVLVPLMAIFTFSWHRAAKAPSPKLQAPNKLQISNFNLRRQLGPPLRFTVTSIAVITLVLSVILPLLQMLTAQDTWSGLLAVFHAVPGAILNSALYAALTATTCVVIAAMTWRFRIGLVFWLTFLVPGVLLGILLIVWLNRPAFSWLYGTYAAVVLAATLRYAAPAWTGLRLALRSANQTLVDAARLEGARGFALFRHGYWPQIAPVVAAVWYLTYLLCLWEVETLLLVIPPGGETVALRIFNLLHYGHNPQVNALCVLLLALAILPLGLGIVTAGLQQRRGRSSNAKAATKSGLGFGIWNLFGAWNLVLGALIAVFCLACSPHNSSTVIVESRFFSHVESIGTRGAALGQFNKPRSLAVDKQDNLYVVDMTGRVQKFSPHGEFLLSWQMPQTELGKPKGMGTDGQGNVIVIEPHYSRVNHFAPDGRLVAQWGRHGTNAGDLAFPRAVAINSKSDLFVSEYGVADRVQCFSLSPTPLLRFVIGHAGNKEGQFNRAEGLACDMNDRLIVADSCNHRVQIFSPDGKFLRTYGRAGTARGELSYPYDVRVDRTGHHFVCEFGNSRIQIFDEHGTSIEVLGSAGNAVGKFHNPWSIALDSRGNLYVADSGNHRVQKFIRKQSHSSR